MFFILLCLALTTVAASAQLLTRRKLQLRNAMRIGIGAAFICTGMDHFVSLEARYLPMIPPYLSAWGRELVFVSGIMEVAGGLGLLLPRVFWTKLGLPDLRPISGIALAMLLSVMVVANAHMAEVGADVAGIVAGPEYLALRPLLQPFILLWALYASGAIFPDQARLRLGSGRR